VWAQGRRQLDEQRKKAPLCAVSLRPRSKILLGLRSTAYTLRTTSNLFHHLQLSTTKTKTQLNSCCHHLLCQTPGPCPRQGDPASGAPQEFHAG
jgi:hypothetical protein